MDAKTFDEMLEHALKRITPALATDIAHQMRRMDSIYTDQHYLASLPIAEQKRLSRIEMARDREDQKRRGK